MDEARGHRRRSLYQAAGSPSWKEAFRQGCLERMRNSRDRLLNRYRQAGGSVPGSAPSTLLVQEVMEEEWSALQSVEGCPEGLAQLEEPVDLAVLEEIQQELAEQERSIISEYEKSLQFDERCLSIMLAEWEANPLICPVCTKSNLRVSSGVVTCPCGLYLSSQAPELTEQKLRACIEDSVSEHSAHCPHTPEFSATGGMGEKPALLMSCQQVLLSWGPAAPDAAPLPRRRSSVPEGDITAFLPSRPPHAGRGLMCPEKVEVEACDAWTVIV